MSPSVSEQIFSDHLQRARDRWEHEAFENRLPRSLGSGQGRIRLRTLKPKLKVIAGGRGHRGRRGRRALEEGGNSVGARTAVQGARPPGLGLQGGLHSRGWTAEGTGTWGRAGWPRLSIRNGQGVFGKNGHTGSPPGLRQGSGCRSRSRPGFTGAELAPRTRGRRTRSGRRPPRAYRPADRRA